MEEQPRPAERPLRSNLISRVIRKGTPEPADFDWMAMTPGQRIDAVWILTKACMAWNTEGDDEPPTSKICRPH